MTSLTEAVNEVSLMAVRSKLQHAAPARPRVFPRTSLVSAREGRVAAAGTLAATVQKRSVWIVCWEGCGGPVLFLGLQTICSVPSYPGGEYGGCDRYQASVLCSATAEGPSNSIKGRKIHISVSWRRNSSPDLNIIR